VLGGACQSSLAENGMYGEAGIGSIDTAGTGGASSAFESLLGPPEQPLVHDMDAWLRAIDARTLDVRHELE